MHSKKMSRFVVVTAALTTFTSSLLVYLVMVTGGLEGWRASASYTAIGGLLVSAGFSLGAGLNGYGWLFVLRLGLLMASAPTGLLLWSNGFSAFIAVWSGIGVAFVAALGWALTLLKPRPLS